MADFARLLERQPESRRYRRFEAVVRSLQLILQRQVVQAVASVRLLGQDILDSQFDFEAACNMVGLLSVLGETSIELPEGPEWVLAIGLRYTNTKALTELLASAAHRYPLNAQALRDCLGQVNKSAEAAVAQSLGGDPQGAVAQLLTRVDATLNTKLLDLAQQLLTRHAARIGDVTETQAAIDALRERCGPATARAAMGHEGERKPGELVLRTQSAEAAAQRKAAIAAPALPADPVPDLEPVDRTDAFRLRPLG